VGGAVAVTVYEPPPTAAGTEVASCNSLCPCSHQKQTKKKKNNQ